MHAFGKSSSEAETLLTYPVGTFRLVVANKGRGVNTMTWISRLFAGKRPQATSNASPQQPVASKTGAPNQASYRDGDKATCGKCGRILRVTYENQNNKFAVADPKVTEKWALRCQGCGFICCTSCAVGPSLQGVPVCPSCKAQGGPYLFY